MMMCARKDVSYIGLRYRVALKNRSRIKQLGSSQRVQYTIGDQVTRALKTMDTAKVACSDFFLFLIKE